MQGLTDIHPAVFWVFFFLLMDGHQFHTAGTLLQVKTAYCIKILQNGLQGPSGTCQVNVGVPKN